MRPETRATRCSRAASPSTAGVSIGYAWKIAAGAITENFFAKLGFQIHHLQMRTIASREQHNKFQE